MFSGEAATAASAIATGLATLTIFGVVKCEKLYEEHKIEKNKKEMQKINDFHDKTLANMTARDHLVVTQISTPPIFQFKGDDGKDLPTAKSLYINSAMFDDLYEKIPICNDAQLLLYSDHIRNAMIQLREFFDARLHERNAVFRGDENDITSSVIYYVILMLSTHCYRVEANAVTLTYLRGLEQFINCFASDHDVKSNRFEYLSLVAEHLSKAYLELFQHSLMFSYKETLDTLCPEIMGVSKKLLRCAIKLITPYEEWGHLKSMTLDKVARGLVKEKIVHTKTINPFVGGSIEIKDSIFKKWIVEAAEDLMLAIKINDNPDDKALFITREKTVAPGEYTIEQMKQIKIIFGACDNFLTARAKPGSMKTKQWIDTFNNQITDRIHFYFRLMRLIQALNVLVYFCAHLSNRIKQLGEIYVSNPHHCIYIFEVLNGMGDFVKKESQMLEGKLAKFAEENGNKMILYGKTQVFTDLETYFRRARELTGNVEYLYKKHLEQPRLKKRKNIPTTLKPNSVMLNISEKVAQAYNLKTTISASMDSPTPVLSDEKSESSVMGNTPDLVTRRVLSTAMLPTSRGLTVITSAAGEESVSPIVSEPDSAGNSVVQMAPITPKKEPLAPGASAALYPMSPSHNSMSYAPIPQLELVATTPPPEDKINLRELLDNIKLQIKYIKENEADSAAASLLYDQAFKALVDLYNRSVRMKKQSDSMRRAKGEKTQVFLVKLSGPFLLFLKLPYETRNNRAIDFARICKDIIDNHDNEFLDWPRIPCSTLFFKTDSRKDAMTFEEKVEAIGARP